MKKLVELFQTEDKKKERHVAVIEYFDNERAVRGTKTTIITAKRRKDMLSQTPLRLDKVRKEDIDKEILRAAIITALDAVNLYEQMASLTANKHIKKALLDIAQEEKTYVEQFQALRNRLLLLETICFPARIKGDGIECPHNT